MTKPLHGQFLRQTQQIAHSKSWVWPTTGGPKTETDEFLMATQDQALQTNAIKVKIDKREGEATLRSAVMHVKVSLLVRLLKKFIRHVGSRQSLQ